MDDTHNGRMRDSAMYKNVMPAYLQKWEDGIRILEPPATKQKEVQPSLVWKVSQVVSALKSSVATMKRHSSLHFSREVKELAPGTWLQVGDVVDASNRCEHNCKKRLF